MNALSAIYDILIFKTNIKTIDDKMKIAPILNSLAQIQCWTVDCEDCDCVLRIEAQGLSEAQIIEIVQQSGFECTTLND